MVSGEPYSRQQISTAYSAGGVCYRLREGVVQVVLIATQHSTRWGLPKGQPFRGELPSDAARRELAEETGINGLIIEQLGTIEYWFRAGSRRIHKFVDLFLLKYESGSLSPQLTEVDDARWVALDEAIVQVSFPRERAMLEQVRQLWDAGKLT